MNPILVDTHAHLNLEPLAHRSAEVLERASSAGVAAVINVGIDLETSERAKALDWSGSKGARVFFTAGIHPHEAGECNEEAISALRNMLDSPGAVAVGEIGLDYYRDRSPRDVQAQAFERQLALADELGLPVVIHDREAHEDTISIIESYLGRNPGSNLKGVFHCFSGDRRLAARVLDLGFYVSFTGVITFKKADTLREVAGYVPSDRMLLETDCPFLAPVPYRGKTNEPAYVVHVAKALAECRDMTLEEVAEWTTRNAVALFGLDLPD